MATAYRYSTGTADIGDAANFAWEYPVPDTAFWNPLGYKAGSSFLRCFAEKEIQAMDLDLKVSFDRMKKLEFLLRKLKEKKRDREEDARPLSWREVDYDSWRLVLLSMILFLVPGL